MDERMNRRRRSAGFSLLEVLVTLVIVVIGLLGLLGMQVRSHQAELESYQRTQALILLSDVVERINTNRKAARCYAISDAAAGTPYVGYANSAPVACTAWSTAEFQARAVADLDAWDALLKGAAETAAGTEVGAMIGARGCVSYDTATDLYRVSVAWQGLISTTEPLAVDPALTCGKDLYGSESQRRIVSTTLKIADLK
jgi:type IV pilus assembly protein PilV